MKHKTRPVLLIILDGFGYSQDHTYNAITPSTAPFWYDVWQKFPHTILRASGIAVGLPAGFIGNSEVGHLTIGSGAIIQQPLTIIHDMIKDGTFYKSHPLVDQLNMIAQTKKRLHILGLLSDAGVHGHIDHIIACIIAAERAGIDNIVIHAILDGRDVDPTSAAIFLETLDPFLSDNIILGSIHGRFYAMDRDNNWDRTQKSYDVLTKNAVLPFDSWRSALDHYYQNNITDEFIPPTLLHAHAQIQADDALIITNVRPERIIQLTHALIDSAFDKFPRSSPPIQLCITPVPYAPDLNTIALLPDQCVYNGLKAMLVQQHKTIFTIAETEKWAHVTYFFDGCQHTIFPGETRVPIASIKAKTYAGVPCMSAPAITDAIIHSLQTDLHDFYLINYANADMVAHSGDLTATQKAITCLDQQLHKLYDVVTKVDGIMIITADHGNAECMIDKKTGRPKTAHTDADVPFVVICAGTSVKFDQKILNDMHGLADIKEFIFSLISSE